MPRDFNPGNETQYPLKRRLGGPQSRSGWFWRIENHFLISDFHPVMNTDILVLEFYIV
jgi:hypothetical protein